MRPTRVAVAVVPPHLFRKLTSQTPTYNQQQQQQQQQRIITLLTQCTNITNLKQIHTHIYIHGFHQNSYILTKLIRTLTRLNIHSSYPFAIFRNTHNPDSFLWAAMIRAHVLQHRIPDSVYWYNSMRRNCISPNSFTFCALLKGCTMTRDTELGWQVHGHLVKFGGLGLRSTLFLNAGNSLVDMYVKCGELGCARKVFDEMSVRDVVTWTSLIVGYAGVGDMECARELFDGLGGGKDGFIWGCMITGYAQNARPNECLELFEMMLTPDGVGFEVEVDEYTLASVISACAQLGTTKYVTCIRGIAERLGSGPETNVVIGSGLVDMYSKCGKVDDAFEVFRLMKERNVYTYSSMILGFAVNGRANAAMQLFYDMDERTDIRPNHVTFVGVLTACSHAGMVEEGRRLFGAMEETYGVSPTADHYTCMVDLLGRSGHLEEALTLANSLESPHPHGGVWGALLGACNIHNNPDIAVIAAGHLFELEPNGMGNYILLFNILASAGEWDKAVKVQNLIKDKGGKKFPACSWVDGKKGHVNEFFAGDLIHPRSNEIRHVLEDLVYKLERHGYQTNLASVSYDISDEDKREILMPHSEKLALGFELLTTESDHTIRIMKNLRICEDCHVFMCGASKITKRDIVVRDTMRFHHFHDGFCSCGNFW
ncbi:pentatricopeptide repeat-containing protein At5g44230-like [Silene latifolia]|uniref:pentatricopeptide repeat-containing protein At5g44230-like n=1 Tax=Silene latifolia TaxID=37657 RepID=UPI003D779F04